MAAAAAGVDEDDHRRRRRVGVLAVGAAEVAGFAGGGVLEADGIAHCEAEVLRHGQLLLQLLLVNPHAGKPAAAYRLHNRRPHRYLVRVSRCRRRFHLLLLLLLLSLLSLSRIGIFCASAKRKLNCWLRWRNGSCSFIQKRKEFIHQLNNNNLNKSVENFRTLFWQGKSNGVNVQWRGEW